jgi:hypothetical protein
MNAECAIWTLEHAMEVVEAVDRDSFGICLVHIQNRFRVMSYSESHETSLPLLVLFRYIIWTTPKRAEDGFETSAARWLDWNRPSALLEALTANRDRRELAA